MKQIKVYHASLHSFDVFEVTEQGIHFGTKESALQAIERKIIDHEYFFLYEVLLDISQFVEEYDQGYDWRSSFINEPDNVKGYIYKNKYEPSNDLSYMTWNPSVINIKNITKIYTEDLEKMIDDSDY